MGGADGPVSCVVKCGVWRLRWAVECHLPRAACGSMDWGQMGRGSRGKAVLSITFGGMNKVRTRTMNSEVGKQGGEEQGGVEAKE